MTPLLQEAVSKLSALPERVQDELALHILDELDWNRRWTEAGGQAGGAGNHRSSRPSNHDLAVCMTTRTSASDSGDRSSPAR
jgi:hypothetical protein